MIVIRQIYQYLIAFVTLVMIISGGIGMFSTVADIASPSPYHQSFYDYKMMIQTNGNYQMPDAVVLSDDDIRADYDEMVNRDKEADKQRAMNRLIGHLGFVVVPLPFFVVMQNRIRKENKITREQDVEAQN